MLHAGRYSDARYAMPPKKKPKRTKFLKKDRDETVIRLVEEDEDQYDDIVDEAVENLRPGVDLKHKDSRKQFVDSVKTKLKNLFTSVLKV